MTSSPYWTIIRKYQNTTWIEPIFAWRLHGEKNRTVELRMRRQSAKWSAIKSQRSASLKPKQKLIVSEISVPSKNHRKRKEETMRSATRRCSRVISTLKKQHEWMIDLCNTQMMRIRRLSDLTFQSMSLKGVQIAAQYRVVLLQHTKTTTLC